MSPLSGVNPPDSGFPAYFGFRGWRSFGKKRLVESEMNGKCCESGKEKT